MNKHCKLDADTKEYINTFYRILADMMQGMTSAGLTDSISHNFIVQMIPHHMAAIEMSKNILEYTENNTLCEIAANIIAEQTKSIQNMRCIENACSQVENSKCDLYCYQSHMEHIVQVMYMGMQCSCVTNRIDCNFLREMIPHHEGAVKMAMTTLNYNICPELIPILEAIITSQKKGIQQMKSLAGCLQC